MKELPCKFISRNAGEGAPSPLTCLGPNHSQEMCVRLHNTNLSGTGSTLSAIVTEYSCDYGRLGKVAINAQPQSQRQIFLDKVRGLCQVLLCFPQHATRRALPLRACIKVLRRCQEKLILPLGFYLDAF